LRKLSDPCSNVLFVTASVIDFPAPEPADEAAFAPSPWDVELSLDETAAWAAVAMRHLGVLRPGRLGQAGRIDALVALERAAAWIAARQARMSCCIGCR
jgi:hypothetical protein